MADETLLITRDGPCVVLTMNRPAALNALSSSLRRALVTAFDTLDKDDSAHVAILTGKGRAFTAGLDLKELAASRTSVSENVDTENVVAAIERFGKPIIAAVNGAAITGGFEIMLACDIVLVSEEAYFADTHVKVGLTPGWGLSQRLGRLIGVHRAKELSFTARRLGAREALAWGLANQMLAPEALMPKALEMAHVIAAWPAAGVRGMKSVIDQGMALPLGDALRMEAEQASRANSAVQMSTTVLTSRGGQT